MRPLTLLLLALTALSAPAAAQSVRFGGSIETNLQLGLGDCGGGAGGCQFLNFRNLNVVGLQVEASFGASAAAFASLAVRNLNFTEIEEFADLGRADAVQPVDFRVREAHLSLYDFLLPGLDLVVGAQRFAWGTADGFNPVDRVNAYDLEDLTRFDRRLASPAVTLAYQAGPVRLEGIFLPLFVPAALPVETFDVTSLGEPSEVFDLGAFRGGTPPGIGRVDMPTEQPAPALENVQAAARVSWMSPVGDLALSYLYGFDSLPQANGRARLTGFAGLDRVDLGVPLTFPRQHVVGATYRGHLVGGLSGWAEVALIVPEETRLTADPVQMDQLVRLGLLDELPQPLPSMTTQEDTPYVNAVAGLEYDLPGGVYANVQYIYGFLTERSADVLHHYLQLALRWRVADGRVHLKSRAVMEVADLEPGGLGWLASASVAYLHGDAVEVELGTTFLDGQERTTLSAYHELSNVYLRAEVKF